MTTFREPLRAEDLPVFSSDHSVPESAPQLARDAAETVRLLNHATFIIDVTPGPESWPGYQSPADVADTLASLKQAVQALPQVFAQADRWLTAALATGHVGDDRRGLLPPTAANDPAVGVANACSDLRAACQVAELLAMNLSLAHAAASHLTYDLDDPDDPAGPHGLDDSTDNDDSDDDGRDGGV